MGAVVALDRLLDGRQVWRGPARQGQASDHLASGHPALDARLPGGGWPASGLCEVLQADNPPAVIQTAAWQSIRMVALDCSPLELPNQPHTYLYIATKR